MSIPGISIEHEPHKIRTMYSIKSEYSGDLRKARRHIQNQITESQEIIADSRKTIAARRKELEELNQNN